jgi:hypothetical protein
MIAFTLWGRAIDSAIDQYTTCRGRAGRAPDGHDWYVTSPGCWIASPSAVT